ncbi:bifunctional 2-polyprenyl-6-hydroxyphenol methylase/3-demethylubiquinol 3-O-methyltransferase UbiG [Hyphomonas sp.]|uniref:class I SAM-dependent methyltransferase n=1 Tax=Hyphomonas sp. TaxID=87 RepID=UPI000C5C0BCA|nr:class I SAM-dependent methyltransferase [Hyphomonas sp.]MAB11503.1 SAM-dependent methyltransferase [Hyphomonas sp.]MAU67727.1 SAM-dependent methyltransferase [Hyphomonas sp.]
MRNYGPETFGELNADEYDLLHNPGTTEAAIELLSEFALPGRTLELAIGTGRVALPLAERGCRIEGIEASPLMVEKLRQKPGGHGIPVTIGDMSEVKADGMFDFVFLIFNTLYNLTSQAAQVNCFRNAASMLAPGGAFLIEAFVPDLSQFHDHRSVKPRHVGFSSLALEAAVHDPTTQRIDYQVLRVTSEGTKLTPLPMRYAWPQETDLMAQLAGMDLETRWGGWDKSDFTANSRMHISVYRKPV